MMITVPFTQYHLPNGKATKQFFDFQDGEIENEDQFKDKLQNLLEVGVHFDAEILSTGIVSFTAERGDEMLSIQLSDNGAAVVNAVENLIMDASKFLRKENNQTG